MLVQINRLSHTLSAYTCSLKYNRSTTGKYDKFIATVTLSQVCLKYIGQKIFNPKISLTLKSTSAVFALKVWLIALIHKLAWPVRCFCLSGNGEQAARNIQQPYLTYENSF